jgi:hypothetical protein
MLVIPKLQLFWIGERKEHSAGVGEERESCMCVKKSRRQADGDALFVRKDFFFGGR